ncbi:DsbA family oxidoreductase [Amycolatopsis palatopharyngis]|uniref:DsbA family oxidoreductase n=1 Tax=Amycolatopsis palatopharyngis TaxID=187982 RepID=UPI000E25BF22|nr:DsbA family oxidoreductase [Amycolatopsis palatopharyngis]
MRIDIWSDIVCPWCAIGKAQLDAALAQFEHADEIELVWRSFELDPGAPAVRDGDYAAMLARKYGTSAAGGEAMVQRMTATAAEAGVEFHLDRARPGNSFDAHRLVHLAADRDLQLVVKQRFLQAYLSEGEAIGEHETLTRLATQAGLDPDEVRDVLASDAYADAVRADESEALRLQISGVPLFLVDGRLAIPGAQPPEVILQTLHRAWRERPVLAVNSEIGDAPSCGPQGCST